MIFIPVKLLAVVTANFALQIWVSGYKNQPMNNRKWIIVSSKVGSRFYEYGGPENGMKLVLSLDNPEAKMKNSEIDSDRPGSTHASSGSAHGSMVPEVDAKSKVVEKFSKEIANELEKARKANLFSRLIMVSEPGFMGQILGSMDNKTSELIYHKLNKDLFSHKPEDILKSLGDVV